MKILTKNCIVCGKKYIKRETTSKKVWVKSRFCSKTCINVGRNPWNKYLIPKLCGNCNKLFQPRENNRKYCCRKCARAKQIRTSESARKSMATRRARYGYIQSPTTREKQRLSRLGSKSHLWKGGLTKKNYRLRRSSTFKNWRKAIYERDDYTCQTCKVRGGRLHPHHIKSWELYPELRFEVSNGQTLCISCHKQTDSYGKSFK